MGVIHSGVGEGEMYKYVISTKNGDTLYKSDPYGFWSEKRPGNASKVANIEDYTWKDKNGMRKGKPLRRTDVNI